MSVFIMGFILRAGDKSKTTLFYSELGLVTQEHEHGGPKHHEVGPLAENSVVEIYQASANFPRDALMLQVDSIDDALHVAKRFHIEPRTKMIVTEEVKFIYITDPDGRDVMLVEKVSK